MARTRKMSREEAREAAKVAFWQYGYSGLGVRKLEEATGINRFMLQTEFGGKTGLFLEALDDYLINGQQMFSAMGNGDLDDIAQVFLTRASDEMGPNSKFGCLAINTLNEDRDFDEEIKKRMNLFLEFTEQAYLSALKNEEAKGSLKDDLNIHQAAKFLVTSMMGLNAFIKSQNSNTAGAASARMVADTIWSWRK